MFAPSLRFDQDRNTWLQSPCPAPIDPRPLGGGCFDVHPIRFDADPAGDIRRHAFAIRSDFRRLSKNDRINVPDTKPFVAQAFVRFGSKTACYPCL